MPAGDDQPLRTAAGAKVEERLSIFPVCSLFGALRISIAFSRQNLALAGRLSERYSASASSVIFGFDRSTSIVICSLSGLPSMGKAAKAGLVLRFSPRL